MKKVAAILALLTSAFAASLVSAQSLPTAKPEEVGLSSEKLAQLTAVIKSKIAEGRYPGAVGLVARKGKIAYFEALGVRDPATNAPMTKDAIFRLYSMTKPFVSVATMMLVEEGRILLGDPVSKYLPKLKNLQVSVPRADPVTGRVTYTLVAAEREMTIQDLLRHTSGLAYDFTNHTGVKEAYAKDNVTWNGVTPAEQIDRLAKAPLAHQPGTAWEYSLSTDVLGRVVEVVTGKPLGEVLQERIFNPLRMPDTAFVVPAGKAARIANPFPKDPVSGQEVKLLDVTQVPKNDAGGAGLRNNRGSIIGAFGGSGMTTARLTAIFEREGKGYTALCPQVDVASQGDTIEEATTNLREAVELFFEAADPDEVKRRLKSEVYVTQLEVAIA